VPHADIGPLGGLTFAVKDIFDVAGYPTGCGNPHKLAASGPKSTHGSVAQRLLDAGLLHRKGHHRRSGLFHDRQKRSFRHATQWRFALAHSGGIRSSTRTPAAAYAANAFNRKVSNNRDEVLKGLANKVGPFFFKGNCVLCA